VRHNLKPMTRLRLIPAGVLVVLIAGAASPASAQLDPLLFLKDTRPYVILAVDTASRMQRDAPSDGASPDATSSYYDPFVYSRTGGGSAAWETTLGVTDATTSTGGTYRRKYVNLTLNPPSAPDKANVATIVSVGDKQSAYASFEAPTRLALARAAIAKAVQMNIDDVLFGFVKMRQKNITLSQANYSPIADLDAAQLTPTDAGSATGRWHMSQPKVSGDNGSSNSSGLLYKADEDTSNSNILSLVAKDPRAEGGLVPAGSDDAAKRDAPVKYMLDDARAEAVRLINADSECTNTIVVMIVGGGEGTTVVGANPAATASSFLNVAQGRRVPVYVVAIAPPSADRPQLQAIASNSGGQYFEITKTHIDAALASPAVYPSPNTGTVVVPELVSAINSAISHGLADAEDVNTAPTALLPFGPSTEIQVTSPVIGTVDLTDARDITGASLPDTVVNDRSGKPLPQRSNLLVTTAIVMPGFTASIRGFRQYKPVAHAPAATGYKFVADGTSLWTASAPAPAKRNLYTAALDGTLVPFSTEPASLGVIASLMNLSATDAALVIAAVRARPLGAVLDSTPAIMNPPSIDPPPDVDYPEFAEDHKDRRTIIWVGTNDGILEGIDARLGVEVWGFIPPPLLPRLKLLRLGQPVTQFTYLMDGSAKVADVKVDDTWRTHLVVGMGSGGTFYQSFDVSLDDMADAVGPDSDDLNAVLDYFASPGRVPLNWSFPKYSSFDPTIGASGDLKLTATAIEKSVGQTWSDPAVGQIQGPDSPFTVLAGSGFFPYSLQQLAHRGGMVAGTTFYLLDAKDGSVLDSKNVGSDGTNETVDNCAANVLPGEDKKKGKNKKLYGCDKIKNALQTDPVATGPSDSRFITKAYLGDLDGRVWRFDLSLDGSNVPKSAAPVKLFESGSDQPIFSSMATVTVGDSKQYVFFGTGSDLLPSTDTSTTYRLLGLLESGNSATKALDHKLKKGGKKKNDDDEKVTAFPAVAGDIVFFTTTTFHPSQACPAPDANLYAFTFTGGPAYDNTGDGKVDNKDSALVTTIAGRRATAPFIVDQHLVFGADDKVALFGDPEDFNNGIGQAGVRILSWREVR